MSIFGSVKTPSPHDLEENLQDLIAKAAAIDDKCRAEKREPTAAEAEEFERIMDVEVPAARRELLIATEQVETRRQMAKARGQQRSLQSRQSDQDNPLLFRDAATGRTVRALRSDEQIAPLAGVSDDDELGGAVIEDGTGRSGASAAHNMPRVGDALVSLVTGAALPDGRSIRSALGGSDTDGAFLLEPQLGGMIIDLARSASVAMRAGAMTLPMNAREVILARADSDPAAQWRAEGVSVQASNPTFGRIILRAKTLAAITPVSIELMEDAANMADVLEAQFRAAMGMALDQAILRGSGAESTPRGIVNHTGVNVVTGVGTPSDYSHITQAVGKILSANYPGGVDGLAWVQNPRDGQTYDGLTATDGQPLRPTPWASEVQRFSTTSMPADLGGGSNESEAILGDFSQVLVGMRTSGVNIRVLEAGQVTDSAGKTYNAASDLQKLVVAYLRADVALLRPSWLTVLDGITAA